MSSQNSPLVSVIVPVYNVKKYVRECLDSIKKQTYKNIEVLMINDGSSDGSEEICKEYEKIDGRFKLYNKKNGGLSDARNYGLDRMRGEYVCFVDSDDVIASEFVAGLMGGLLNNTGCQISCCRYMRFRSEDVILKPSNKKKNSEIVSAKNYLVRTLYQNDQTLYTVSVCTKLFRRDIFEKLRFPRGVLYEDLAVVGAIMEECRHLVLIDKQMYYYRTTDESITTSMFRVKKMDMIRHCEGILERYGADKQVQSATMAMIFSRSFELLLMLKHSRGDNTKAKKELWNNIKKYRKKIIGDKFVRGFVRMSALLTFLGENFSVSLLTFIKYRSIF